MTQGSTVSHRNGFSLFGIFFVAMVLLIFIPVQRHIPVIGITPTNFLSALFIIVLIASLPILRRRLSRNVVWLFGAYVAFVLWDILGTILQTGTLGSARSMAITVINRILLGMVFILFIQSKRRYQVAFKFVLNVILLVTVFSLLEHFFVNPFRSIRLWLLTGGNNAPTPSAWHIMGFFSVFQFGYVVAAAPILSVTLYLQERKLYLLATTALFLAALIMNGERSAISALAIGLAYLTWKLPARLGEKLRRGFVIGMLMLGIVMATIPLLSTLQIDKYTSTNREEILARVWLQVAGLETVLKNPLLGITEGASYQIIALNHKNLVWYWLYEQEASEIPWAHNGYINIGLRAGFPGIAAFCIFMLEIMHIAEQFKKKAELLGLRMYYLGVTASLASAMLNALFHNSSVFTGNGVTWILLDLLVGGSLLHVPPSADRGDNG